MMATHRGNADVEDLGTQTIAGVEARGERVKMSRAEYSGSGTTFTEDSVTERWCSEDLSALVLTISQYIKTGRKSTVAMRNIERTEPDPQLFQIPPNYTITETTESIYVHTTTNGTPASQP
jgi:hypothetical protein